MAEAHNNSHAIYFESVDDAVFGLSPNGLLPAVDMPWIAGVVSGGGHAETAAKAFCDVVAAAFKGPADYKDGKPVGPALTGYAKYLDAALERHRGFDPYSRMIFEANVRRRMESEVAAMEPGADLEFLMNVYGNRMRALNQLGGGELLSWYERGLARLFGPAQPLEAEITTTAMMVTALTFKTVSHAGVMDLDDDRSASIDDTLRWTAGTLLGRGKINEEKYRKIELMADFITKGGVRFTVQKGRSFGA